MTAADAPVEALRLGVLVEQARLMPRSLTVVGVFGTSFHVAGPDVLLAVGGPGMENGPLNVVCAGLAGGGWRAAGVVEGSVCALDADRLRVAGGPAIALQRATVWQPAPWPAVTSGQLAAGLGGLRTASAGRLPSDGLAPLVMAPADAAASPLGRVAGPRIAALRGWLAGAPAAGVHRPVPVTAVGGLVGLGPGLTPSGDDLLCGAMLALHAIARRDLAAHISSAVAASGPAATTPLGRAFLAAAAAGHAGETLHDAIAALVSGAGDWPGLVSRAGAIGHTSGWDALAGAVLALEGVTCPAADTA